MKRMLQIIACSALMLFAWACERPQSPDFKLDHKVQVPLIVGKTYQFLGNSGALIDTTGKDFNSLFTIDKDGLISIAKEENFDFGNLNNAIPEVNVDPVTVISEVGEISLKNFSSAGNIGTASFKEITGETILLQKGDNLPGGSTPGTININLDTDYFTSAIIKNNGSLKLTVVNNLGFDIDNLSITLKSGSLTVGTTAINPFSNNATETCSIDIPANTNLSNLNVDITAGWSRQYMQEDANNLIVKEITGKNLVASQVTAAIESQEFSSTGISTIDDSEIKFTKSDHFIELSKGKLLIDISNKIDIGIKNLKISFPDIERISDGTPLVMNLSHIPPKSSGGSFFASSDLSGYRIYALGNKINYDIRAVTENTQQGAGSEVRTINEKDELRALVELHNLEIDKAKGEVKPRTVLLNDDEGSDKKLGLFNDREAEITSIGGISNLSDKISGITFANPVLSTIYGTNLTANTTVYAAIAGVNADGKTVYLTGNAGGKYDVPQSEVPAELTANGNVLDEDQIIKFNVEPSADGSVESGLARFDSTETNASEFFSNLPSKIRFIGIARINDDGGTETISTPIIFDSRMSVDLPLHFSAKNVSFTDTLDADLSDLPGEGDEQHISQATFTINYINSLPFGFDLSLIMIDENGVEVTRQPLNTQNPMSVPPAYVDPITRFVEDGGEKAGKLQFSLTADQLKTINRTRSIILEVNFETALEQKVKVRAEDSLTFRMKMSADLTSTVN